MNPIMNQITKKTQSIDMWDIPHVVSYIQPPILMKYKKTIDKNRVNIGKFMKALSIEDYSFSIITKMSGG